MQRCPCCGYLTINNSDEVITDVCDICFWQYNITAHNNSDKIIGPNKVSFKKAKENYKIFGACEERFVNKVRAPFKYEL